MRLTLLMAALLLSVTLGWCQQPGPPMGPPMFMMGPGMGMPGPGSPPVTMLVSDGVLYLACNGKLTAYDARTLKALAEVTYWQPPQPPQMPGMPGGPPGPPPGGPPPAAP